MADINRQVHDNKESIVVESTGEWVSYQAAMILRQQPEGFLTAFSSDTTRWIGYIRPWGACLSELSKMPEAGIITDSLQKLYEAMEKLLLDPAGLPLEPELWFYADGQLSCVYIPEIQPESQLESQNRKEKIAYMFLVRAVQTRSPESVLNDYYRFYLEASGVKRPLKYSLSETWSAYPYIADFSPADMPEENFVDLLGEEEPEPEKGKLRYSLFRRKEKRRK